MTLSNSKLGCALVGYGYWGPKIARNIHTIPEADLLYICDLNPDNLTHANRDYPNSCATNQWGKVLADSRVEAVIVATPIKTHGNLAHQALEAGKHVFVEKPLAHTSSAARSLIEKANCNSLILMTGHTYLYSPTIRQIKDLVDAKELGQIVHVSASRMNFGPLLDEMSVIWDLMPHDISILSYIFGDHNTHLVRGSGASNLKEGVTDTAHAMIHYEGGLTAELRASWIYPNKTRLMHFIGTQKILLFDDTKPLEKIQIIDRSLVAEHLSQTSTDNFPTNATKNVNVPMPVPDETEPLFAEMREFISCALEDRTPLSDGYLGLAVVEMLEEIEASMQNATTDTGLMVPLVSGAPVLANR